MSTFICPIPVQHLTHSCPPTDTEDPVHGVGTKHGQEIGFFVDQELCIGCHACTVACFNETFHTGYPEKVEADPAHLKAEEADLIGQKRRWVVDKEEGHFPDVTRMMTSVSCRHCAEPKCVDICPTQAISKAENGAVTYSMEACIGCNACKMVCPYDVPQFAVVGGEEKMIKCTYCQHLDQDAPRPCEQACLTGALVSGPVHKLADIMGERGYELQYRPTLKETLSGVGHLAAVVSPAALLIGALHMMSRDQDPAGKATTDDER